MEEERDVLEKRKGKIVKWLKNPYNLAILGIILFTIAIRLYYFFLTKSQPLWWDEAEYMNMARHWAFGAKYVFDPVRQILFPIFITFFLKISNSDFIARLFLMALSFASVIGTYLLGKEVYIKRIGLLSAFLMSVFYLNLFFTYRLLVDMHSLVFFTFSALLFYRYLTKGSKKSLYWAAVLIAIGTMFKLSTAFLLPAIFVYLLITEKLSFIKKKEIWISGLIFFLVLSPYLIWGYTEFGGFILTQAPGEVSPDSYTQRLFDGVKGYFSLFPVYLSWPLLIIFLLGIGLMYKLFLGFDVLIKRGDRHLKRDLFLLLIFLIPILLVSGLIDHNENRYILNAFPSIFIISSVFVFYVFDLAKKKSKIFAALLLIGFIFFTASFQLESADPLIKGKATSYEQVRQAGLKINEISTSESDVVITSSHPQIKYYAQREILPFSESESEFENLLESNQDIKFFIVSVFEYHPDWAYAYPQKNNLEAVDAYFADQEKTQILLATYKLRD